MSLDIFWFLPTSGDTRYLGKSESGRPATNQYMRQIAVAAESLGYDGLLIPTGSSCLDPWVTAASLVPVTSRIKLLVALRTSVSSPTVTARQPRPGPGWASAAQRGPRWRCSRAGRRGRVSQAR
ncbi:hypothetical protein QF017_000994 [Pseudomonas laurylsulfatiphila]